MNNEKSINTLPYQHPYGDLFGDYGHYFTSFDPNQYNHTHFYTLSVFDVHPWHAMATFAPDMVQQLQKLSEYECPYLKRTYHALLPRFLITQNPKRYQEHFRQAYSIDLWKFISEDLYQPDESIRDSLSAMAHCLLGTGYRMCALPSDGTLTYDTIVLPLSDGDSMVFTALIWCNN